MNSPHGNIVSKPGELDYVVNGGSFSNPRSERFGDQAVALQSALLISQDTELPATIHFDGKPFAHVIAVKS